MLGPARIITKKVERRQELPEKYSRGVSTWLELDRLGVLEGVEERLRFARQGGYGGFHLFVLAVLHLSCGARGGLQPFCQSLGEWSGALGAVVGQRRLPSASSSSRLLTAVPRDVARSVGRWLLTEAVDPVPLLRCEATLLRDARRRSWHVFDYDPTVDTLCRRSLQERPDAPPSRRRSEGFAAPGYTGRKRGDVRIRRSAMQHAGTGLWTHCAIDDGKGNCREHFEAAVVDAKALAHRADPEAGVLIRSDAEFSGVPYLDVCARQGVQFLTRLPRHALLERPSVQQLLREATWFPVANSGGPQKYAAELGWCRLDPADETVGADGAPFPAQWVRVVVTRTPRDGAAGKGTKIGDEQVEMFATTVDEGAMPAVALCECYQRRSSLENRFAQEDRELGLDRIFCYEHAGQELVTSIGLFLWNVLILGAFAARPVPEGTLPAPERASPVPASLPPLFDEPPVADEPDAGPPPATDAVEPSPDAELAEHAARVESLEACLDHADWETLGRGWSRPRGKLALVCPAGKELTISYVQTSKKTRGVHRSTECRVVYRTCARACVECPFWERCHSAPDDTPQKSVGRSLSPGVAVEAHALLREIRRSPVRAHRPRAIVPAARPSARWRPEPWTVERRPAPVGTFVPEHPRFLPREARKSLVAWMDELRFTVHVRPGVPLPRPVPHPFVRPAGCETMPPRQSWARRAERYALDPSDQVDVVVRAPTERHHLATHWASPTTSANHAHQSS